MPAELTSLDAIHLATAQLFGPELHQIVTYDNPHGDRSRGARLARRAAWLSGITGSTGLDARSIGPGEPRQYQNPIETPANRWHIRCPPYQKKSCKSPLIHGFSLPSENRGVLGSIPSLATPFRLLARLFRDGGRASARSTRLPSALRLAEEATVGNPTESSSAARGPIVGAPQ
jgi:hypothetical protein